MGRLASLSRFLSTVRDKGFSCFHCLKKNDPLLVKLVYFVSKAVQGSEIRYQKIEQVTLPLLITSWHLRFYF